MSIILRQKSSSMKLLDNFIWKIMKNRRQKVRLNPGWIQAELKKPTILIMVNRLVGRDKISQWFMNHPDWPQRTSNK
jgi:hypothetical protein